MGTNGASEVNLSGTSKEECSETTVEIKIKTLDSQTYTLRVDKYVPVPALKEQIADITGVLSEQQRLICRGKVLKDDQLLSAYHVEDGHTLHLVVRQPIDSSSASTPRFIGSDSGLNSGSNLNHSAHSGNLVFGPINLPDQGDPAASDLSRIFSSVISSLGISSFGTGNAREQAFERNGRTSGSGGPSDSSQSQTDQASARAGFDSYVGGFQFSNATSLGNQHPTVIPDSCTTLTQYMDHMRHEFVSIGRDLNNNSQSTDTNGGEGHDSHLHSAARQGLPTPASLAEVILSARQLLIENTASCLSDLAAQLQDQGSVVDPQARATIQSNIMRSGVLIQNLGPLLLELGRTIMTLRVGQTPEEAIVNAGPAIFVSASSPNPIMVQAGTSFSGISMGALHPGHIPTVSLGPGLISRNIDITIRRAQASDNLDGQTSGQQPSERTGAASTVHQAFQGISGRASAAREPTVHVVPIRTVIAIPGVNHRPSDSSGSADTSLRPLRARLQQQIPGNTNDARNPLASSEQRIEGSSQHPPLDLTNEYVERIQNILSTSSTSTALEHAQSQQGNSGVSHVSTQGSVDSEATEAHPSNGFRTMEQFHATNSSLQTTAIASDADQTITSTEEQVLSRQDNEDGVFFSALVRQLMPLLSQNATTENSVDSSLHPGSSMEQVEDQSSAVARRRPDSPNAPASKRQKRD